MWRSQPYVLIVAHQRTLIRVHSRSFAANSIGEEIVNARRGITADTALRLARYFNTTPKFWLNLQSSYDLAIAAEAKQKEIARTVHPREAA